MTRSRFLRLLGGAAVAIVGSASAAQAKPNRRNRKKRPATRKGAPSELPTVKRVGAGSITVGDKYYEVSKDADITVNGKRATLKAIKPGMQVMVTGSVLAYGSGSKDNIYKATRITARKNDNLKKKADAANKRQKQKGKKR